LKHLTEPPPARFIPLPAVPGVQRIVAPNPGPMTCHGTNTWLIDTKAGRVVLDPGPDDAAHVAAILYAGPVSAILVSHTHPDHIGALPALRAATRVPVLGAAPIASAPGYAPDRVLADGATALGLTAIATPGHIANHLCFAWNEGVLFSADHVMAWATSVVIPPDGDMAAYMASLDRLLARDDRLYLPGHGPALPDPLPYVAALKAHRLKREEMILAALRDGPATTAAVVARVYGAIDPRLTGAAAASAEAHLLKCQAEGRVRRDGASWLLGQAVAVAAEQRRADALPP
jgi:glyoxylase-like metal-dependent hydrolase (beta-lactamase superfamily II)